MEHALDRPALLAAGPASAREDAHESGMLREEFSSLYESHYGPMVRLAFLMLGSQEQAEDVVHDALARIIERWDRVEHHGAYLRTSVVNGARSVLRRRRLTRRHPTEEIEATDPEAEYLADLLATLTPTRRAVIVLRYFEQLTIPEIAHALGLREGTVKSTLHRTLHLLRQEFRS